MKRILLAAALAAAAGLGLLAADGGRYDCVIANPTGGVARAMCRVGTVSRLDYALDKDGTLELVRAVGSTVLSVTTITNAAASGSVTNLGVTGGDDYIQLRATTNCAAKVYMVTQ